MFTIEKQRMLDEEEAEVKVIPVSDSACLLQISSSIINGTLIVSADIEKDELAEFTDAIYTLIQHYSMYNDNGNQLPQ